MSKFLWLELDYFHGRRYEPPSGIRRLDRRLREAGHDVTAVITDEGFKARGSFEEQILNADVLLLNNSMLLEEANVQRAIVDAVNGTSRLLVFAERLCRDPDSNGVGIDFLRTSFGIVPRAVRLDPNAYPPHWSLAVEDQPYVQHFPFIEGIDRILLNRPSHVAYTRDAFPLLVLPERAYAIDPKSDRFTTLGAERPSVAVGWPTGDDTDVRVLAISGTFLPTSSHDDDLFPNDRLVDQLMFWLATAAPNPSWRSRPMILIDPIETRLNDLVVTVLKAYFGAEHWWEQAVPERIRRKVEIVEGFSLTDPQRSLNLVHYKDIIQRNWVLFAPVLDPGDSMGRRAVEWIEDLNRIRRRAAHPVKLRGNPITDSEWIFLQRVNNDLDRAVTTRGLEHLRELRPPIDFRSNEMEPNQSELKRAVDQGYVTVRRRSSWLSNSYFEWCSEHRRVYVRVVLDEDSGSIEVTVPAGTPPLGVTQIEKVHQMLSDSSSDPFLHTGQYGAHAQRIGWSQVEDLAERIWSAVHTSGEGGAAL